MNYCFVPIREKNRNTAPQKAIETHTLLIPGILQERLATNKTAGTSNDNDSDDSVSNDGSHCDMEESAFHIDPVEVDEDEDGVDIFGRDWSWKWEKLEVDDDIEGPEEHDHYNRRHGLKDGVGESFGTVLQCIFQTTAMNQFFLKDLLCTPISMQERK